MTTNTDTGGRGVETMAKFVNSAGHFDYVPAEAEMRAGFAGIAEWEEEDGRLRWNAFEARTKNIVVRTDPTDSE